MIDTPPKTDIGSDASREEIGTLLRVGVTVAALTVIAGGFLFLTREPAGLMASFHEFNGESAALRSARGVATSALHGDARAIIQLGILMLIATPIARVVFGAISFLRARDWIYVGISGTVLVLLLVSLFMD